MPRKSYQKSFGEPNQAKGIKAAATMNIQKQNGMSTPVWLIKDWRYWDTNRTNSTPTPNEDIPIVRDMMYLKQKKKNEYIQTNALISGRLLQLIVQEYI